MTNETFQQLTIHPPLPCVYHDCDGLATVAIAYAVSENEWRMVPTCERHTVSIPTRQEKLSDVVQPEETTAARL
jgi:hypothetical protein